MGIYFEDRGFAKALKTAVLKQTTRFTYTTHKYHILKCDDHNLKQKAERERKIKLQERGEAVSFLNNRGITHLFHFTPLPNLPSIAKYGICPRFLMEEDSSLCIDKCQEETHYAAYSPGYLSAIRQGRHTAHRLDRSQDRHTAHRRVRRQGRHTAHRQVRRPDPVKTLNSFRRIVSDITKNPVI